MRRGRELERHGHAGHDVVRRMRAVAEFENDGRCLVEIVHAVLLGIVDDVAVRDVVDLKIARLRQHLWHRTSAENRLEPDGSDIPASAFGANTAGGHTAGGDTAGVTACAASSCPCSERWAMI